MRSKDWTMTRGMRKIKEGFAWFKGFMESLVALGAMAPPAAGRRHFAEQNTQRESNTKIIPLLMTWKEDLPFNMSVSIYPGTMALTRMPKCPNSCESDVVRPIIIWNGMSQMRES